jgi:hypothetical protein
VFIFLRLVQFYAAITASGADSSSSFPLLRWHGEILDAIKLTEIPYALIAPAHFYKIIFYSAKNQSGLRIRFIYRKEILGKVWSIAKYSWAESYSVL